MKKILYGVSGIGNGHANRQVSIIEELSKDNLIYILAYQDSFKKFTNKFANNQNIKIIEIAVPFVVGRKEGLDFGAIGGHEFNQNIDFLKINSNALGIVSREIGVPDLVITDYEPISAAYAYSQNAPLVTIDQQSKYLSADLPKELGGFTFEDEIQRLHMFFPKAAARIAVSFFRTTKKINGDEVIFFPPPIKEEVANMKRKPENKNQILVYISSAREFVQSPKEVMEILGNNVTAFFNLFVSKEEIDEYQKYKQNNVGLYPTGDPKFLDFMSSCDGIITTAGHSLLSESMYLGIPVYAIPVAPHEQHLNASAIGDNNFGMNYSKLDRDKLKNFVSSLDEYTKNIREDKKILIRGIGQELIVDYLRKNFLSKKRILVISPPFSGHLNVLKEFINDTKDNFYYHLVITGWENIKPDLSAIDSQMVTVLNDGQLHETDPALWTFPRAVKLLPDCLKIIDDFKPDLIIYDFFSIEGFLTGKIKNIPYWCSIPAMIGPFENQTYRDLKIKQEINQEAIAKLEKNFGLKIDKSEVEMVSDGFHLPGIINLVWSFEEITPSDFMKNRSDKSYIFIGNPRGDNYEKSNYKNTKPMIFISFGTVVMDNLWNNQEDVRNNLTMFFENLAKKWSKKNYQVILATQGKKILDKYPRNWWVYDKVNQVEILSRTDLFITHGGSNSFHEAVMQKVPMAVIPFFGDQLLVAKTTTKLGFGEQVGGSQSIDTHSSKNFLDNKLVESIDKYVNQALKEKKFVINYLHTDLNNFDLKKLIKGEIQFNNGDLVIGGGKVLPRSREELPIRIDDYLKLIELSENDYPNREIYNIVNSLKYFLKGIDVNQRRNKTVEFFESTYKVHCLIDEKTNDPDIKMVTEYYRNNGGNIIFYKILNGTWAKIKMPTTKTNNRKKMLIDKTTLILASDNKIKKDAVRKAFSKSGKIKITGLKPQQKYNEQLVGMDEIIEATINRMKEIENMQNRKSILISIVSGMISKNNRWLDIGLILIKDEKGNLALTKSGTIEFPRYVVEKTINRGVSKYTTSLVLGEEFADKKINFDPYRLMTSRKQKRLEVLAEAIRKAWERL